MGKTILVTGVTSGLGLETARVLAKRGARIVGLARTVEKAGAAMRALPNAPVPVACDLADLPSVRAAVATVRGLGVKLDAVICNAGIMALPTLEQRDGYELQFFTNHVGHFILVTGLLEDLADDGRVVMLSSHAHTDVPAAGIEFDNLSGELRSDRRTYGQSKLAPPRGAAAGPCNFEAPEPTIAMIWPHRLTGDPAHLWLREFVQARFGHA